MSLKITFDACIADSIHVSVQRSRPRFDYHLHECGLEKLIKDASMQQKEEFRTVGELVLQASLARYIHQRWKPETPLCYHGAIRIRAMYVFVGAMLAALGYTYTLEWFLATFGLIIDGASAAYDIYQEDLELKLSMKSRSSDIERPSRKRPKLAHFAKVTAPFGKLNATPCGIGPFVNPPLPKVLDQIDILSIFGQPPADTLSISANTKTYPSLVPRFSLSGLRGQARDVCITAHFLYSELLAAAQVIAGIAAFGRREVAAFQAAAFPGGHLHHPPFPASLLSRVHVSLNRRSGKHTIAHSTSVAHNTLVAGAAPERRFPLTYRRSRAPSLPSPRISINVKPSRGETRI